MDVLGPGRYDGWCTRVRQAVHAKGVLLIVLGGDEGPGFSCQADVLTTARIPEILETVAYLIRGQPSPNEETLKESLLQAAQDIAALRKEIERLKGRAP